jgi:hypothetical protein
MIFYNIKWIKIIFQQDKEDVMPICSPGRSPWPVVLNEDVNSLGVFHEG